MQNLQSIEENGKRVLTTEQIAACYGVSTQLIKNNFNYNKAKYTEGKHYISLEGDALRDFKARFEIQTNLKYAHTLYLWTEKGALLHAKSLNTDKAWEVYDWLIDFYFRVKEEKTEQQEALITRKSTKVNPCQIPEMSDPILVFKVLLKLAEENGISVRSYPLSHLKSCLYGKDIGIDEKLNLREVNFELAYELTHAIVHYNCGNLIDSPLRKEYDLHAERMAQMMLKLLNTKVKYRSKTSN